ncbi:MAG: hypothetical protein NXI31_03160 [bacterium]|nr:hypothetical protein [bacterium]
MMPTRSSLAALATLLSTTLGVAQATWIVDSLNRPGTHFTGLDAAVAASSNGDVLLVRWVDPTVAPYSGATIDHGLTILGIGGQPGFVGALRIQGVPAGQHVVLRDLRLAPFVSGGSTTGQCHLLLFSNAGTVHLHNIDRDAVQFGFPSANQIQITDCDLVTLTDCSLHSMYGSAGVMNLARNRLVTMHRCHITASSIAPPLQPYDSEVVLIDTTVTGYPATIGSGGPAVGLCGSELRVAGTSQLNPGFLAAAVVGYGSCGPNHVVVGANATVGVVTNATVTHDFVPALGAGIDSTHRLDVSVEGEPGGFTILRAGFPAPAPTFDYGGWVYLDHQLSFSLLGLVTSPTGRATWTSQLPTTVPAGTGIWLQGFSLGTSGIRVTTASAIVTP